MMVVAMPVVMAPIPLTINFFRQCSPFFASQRRTIPAWDKRKGHEDADGIQRNEGVGVALEDHEQQTGKESQE